MLALLSPEAQFLALTAGGTANDPTLRKILERPFDWPSLCALALADRASSVVWRRLQRLGCTVPNPAAEYLSRATMVSEFELLRAAARLEETIRALDRDGIRVVLLKGAAVVKTAYRSFAERPMADFDLLVEPNRIEAAQRIAMTIDWTRSPSAAPDDVYGSHHHAVPLLDERGTRMQLELHTGLFIPGHPFALTADMVRREAHPSDLGGCEVGVPSRALLMVHACLHFAWSHTMCSGGWRAMRDVAILAEGQHGIWDEFVQLAIETRGATCCYWTLRFARDLATIPIPNRALERLRPALPEAVLSRIGRHFALHLFASPAVCPSALVDRAMWNAAILPGRSGHRNARPWDQTHGFLPATPIATRAERTRTRIGRHLALSRQWGNYLRVVLGGSPRPESPPLREAR